MRLTRIHTPTHAVSLWWPLISSMLGDCNPDCTALGHKQGQTCLTWKALYLPTFCKGFGSISGPQSQRCHLRRQQQMPDTVLISCSHCTCKYKQCSNSSSRHSATRQSVGDKIESAVVRTCSNFQAQQQHGCTVNQAACCPPLRTCMQQGI